MSKEAIKAVSTILKKLDKDISLFNNGSIKIETTYLINGDININYQTNVHNVNIDLPYAKDEKAGQRYKTVQVRVGDISHRAWCYPDGDALVTDIIPIKEFDLFDILNRKKLLTTRLDLESESQFERFINKKALSKAIKLVKKQMPGLKIKLLPSPTRMIQIKNLEDVTGNNVVVYIDFWYNTEYSENVNVLNWHWFMEPKIYYGSKFFSITYDKAFVEFSMEPKDQTAEYLADKIETVLLNLRKEKND